MTKREKYALTGFGAFALALGVYFQFGQPVKENGITQIKVYSLRPEMRQAGEKPAALFFDYPVLGSTTINDPKQIGEIVGALNADLGRFVPNMCIFEPRHGVSIHYGSKVRDFVICYTCGDVQKHDGKRMTSYTLQNQNSRNILTGILNNAGVAIAP